MFTKFLQDEQGFFYTVVVIVVVLFVADISYLVIALTNNSFFDAFAPYIGDNLYMQQLQSNLRYVGPITIVALNLGLIILLIISAWKRQSVETEVEELLL